MSAPQIQPELTEQEWEVARWWLGGTGAETTGKALGLPDGEARHHQAEIIRKITGSYDQMNHSLEATGPFGEVAIWLLEHDPNPPDWYSVHDWYLQHKR